MTTTNVTGKASPVRHDHVPNWLRLAWVRDRPSGAGKCYRGAPAGWAVAMEIRDWLDRQMGQADMGCCTLDHWGSAEELGALAFVNEPYADKLSALAYFRPLAEHLGCPVMFGEDSAHGFGTVRVALLPPGFVLQVLEAKQV